MNDYDPLERLTLLAAHAIDLRPIPSSFNRLTPADIAAKLAKVPRGASLLARVKVAGQAGLVGDLIRALRTAAVEARIPWPTNKRTLLPKMAELALREVLDPKVCKTCSGVAELPEIGEDNLPTGRIKVCAECNGGKYRYTDYARYTYIGVHQEEWKRKWNRPYLEILTIAWKWEGDVRDALK